MHKKQTRYILFLLVLFSLAACQRTKPQSPSNKPSPNKTDDAALAMVLAQQRMAEEADKEVMRYIKEADDPQFAMGESTYWCRRTKRTDGSLIDKDQELNLRQVFCLFDGTMLTDMQQIVVPSKAELLMPVFETLQTMHYGEEAELVVPWYLAFGSTGNQYVPPYTNLRITIITQ